MAICIFDDIHKAAGLSKTFGPIEVEAHGGIHVIATAHIVSNERTGAYLEAVDVSTAGRSAGTVLAGKCGVSNQPRDQQSRDGHSQCDYPLGGQGRSQ